MKYSPDVNQLNTLSLAQTCLLLSISFYGALNSDCAYAQLTALSDDYLAAIDGQSNITPDIYTGSDTENQPEEKEFSSAAPSISTSALTASSALAETHSNATSTSSSGVIGVIFDDVYVDGQQAELTLDFDSGIPLMFSHFYWLGHDSARTGNEIQGADIGSASDPFFYAIQNEKITLSDGEQLETTALVAAMPEGDYKNDFNDPDSGRMDMGVLMTLEHESGNRDETWLLFNGMDLDASYLKLWAASSDNSSGGLALSGEINFHADELIFQTASIYDDNLQGPSDDLSSAWKISQFDAYLPLGQTLYQPLTIDSDEDQHLVIEIAAVNANSAELFYNAPLGNFNADNITLNNWNAGSSHIEGIQLQHLRIQTHDVNR